MYRIACCRCLIVFLLIFGLAGVALAGEPTESIRQTTDKIIAILQDPAFQEPEKEPERKRLIRLAADERFNWREMARRSLARHWKKRTNEEKQEFVALYADLLERTYMNRIENYSGEKVTYDGERIEGNYSLVNITVYTSQDLEIPVQYRLKKRGSDWLIYDVLVEGVSLINNYRQQFNDIILKSSYEDLVEQLRKKVANE
ncbi:MAG: ABC transporter substrate-binding protein [Deltaproteobacteria bacterium]|nr:MAG: ABC transporter substrate-binding protein [Deltaproteobacteria bacterium]